MSENELLKLNFKKEPFWKEAKIRDILDRILQLKKYMNNFLLLAKDS